MRAEKKHHTSGIPVLSELNKKLMDILLGLEQVGNSFSTSEMKFLYDAFLLDKTSDQITAELGLSELEQNRILSAALEIICQSIEQLLQASLAYEDLKNSVFVLPEDHADQVQLEYKKNNLPFRTKMILNAPLENYSFSPRVRNVFARENMTKVSDILRFNKKEFLRLRNCGEKTVKEIEAFLKENHLDTQMAE